MFSRQRYAFIFFHLHTSKVFLYFFSILKAADDRIRPVWKRQKLSEHPEGRMKPQPRMMINIAYIPPVSKCRICLRKKTATRSLHSARAPKGIRPTTDRSPSESRKESVPPPKPASSPSKLTNWYSNLPSPTAGHPENHSGNKPSRKPPGSNSNEKRRHSAFQASQLKKICLNLSPFWGFYV